MNFCSIEDAWGDNKISAQYQKYKGNDNDNDKSCSNPTKNDCSNKNVEYFSNKEINLNIVTCDQILDHINTCKHCYNKLYHKLNAPQKNEFVNNLHNIINNNKDMIVLILIGLFIVMFFKLVNNITSK